MAKRLLDWLDGRTGYRALFHAALEEPIPGGARWRYVFGSALSSTFLIQLVTGILLMFTYSPSATTAWGSVYYINNVMTMGWLIRGVHHFGSQAMVILLGLHLIQVVIAGAFRAPREVNWWFGLALMFITLGFSLTGYLLPWDQKGYWATKVATNIAGGAPLVGPYIQSVVVGGSNYGNQTITRFYGLHVGVLPLLLVLCLIAHVTLFRKHGITPPRNPKGVGVFWPIQVLMDTVASVVVLGILILLTVGEHGADLDAPADPSSQDYPARPEWYFLSLFQMLKLFPGDREVIGTLVIPGAIMTVLFLIPLFDKILPWRLTHFLACSIVFGLAGGVGYLTYTAFKEDGGNKQYIEARKLADETALRARELAKLGIPPEGAGYLLTRDPLTHGKAILASKCLSCHYFDGKGSSVRDENGKETMIPQVASDLSGYGTRAWVRGLLENPSSDHYFGKVPQCDGMAQWKKTSKLKPAELDLVADFVALFAAVDPETTPTEWANEPKVANHPGLAPFVKECGQCHIVGESGLISEGGVMDAPNLYGWGSSLWTTRMIKKPSSESLYGYLEKKDQMPSFADQLTPNDLQALIRYLNGDYPGGPNDPAAKRKAAATARNGTKKASQFNR